jgi:chromosome segregation ATPase
LKALQLKLKEETEFIKGQSEEIEILSKRIEELEDDLDAKTDAFVALQSDMELLNEKYVDEIERVAEIQHSKDMVENELEDLSRRLFEEANGMVANEKREKYNLEVAQRHLENQLKETRERLHAEQMQLKELRIRMEEMETRSEDDREDSDSNTEPGKRSSNASDAASRGLSDMTVLLTGSHKRQSQNGSEVSLVEDNIDELVLREFRDFIATGRGLPWKT